MFELEKNVDYEEEKNEKCFMEYMKKLIEEDAKYIARMFHIEELD